ncbi:hypothetical protein CCP3SC1_1740005 [Gammaproteobacteria bacterium]
MIVLKRTRGTDEATLYVDGRDIERAGEYGLRWDGRFAKWTISEEGTVVGLSPERKAVFDVIKQYGPINGKDVTRLMYPGIEIDRNTREWATTRKIISKLIDSGLVINTANGFTLEVV